MTILQNYTYVDPVVDPLLILAAFLGCVFLCSGFAAAYLLRRSPRTEPSTQVTEPFVPDTVNTLDIHRPSLERDAKAARRRARHAEDTIRMKPAPTTQVLEVNPTLGKKREMA